MSIGWVLSISQEDKYGAILMSKVPLTYGWHFRPVGFIPVLQFYLSLPMVKMAQGHCHHQALMCHQCPVALQGPGALQMVNIVQEHQDREVPEGSLVGDLPVLVLSGSVVMHIVFSCQVELPSTDILGPA